MMNVFPLNESVAVTRQVHVRLAADGSAILIEPMGKTGGKSASVLFGRAVHRGKPVAIEEIQGAVSAARLARRRDDA